MVLINIYLCWYVHMYVCCNECNVGLYVWNVIVVAIDVDTDSYLFQDGDHL